jgi:hypothetical protein
MERARILVIGPEMSAVMRFCNKMNTTLGWNVFVATGIHEKHFMGYSEEGVDIWVLGGKAFNEEQTATLIEIATWPQLRFSDMSGARP